MHMIVSLLSNNFVELKLRKSTSKTLATLLIFEKKKLVVLFSRVRGVDGTQKN